HVPRPGTAAHRRRAAHHRVDAGEAGRLLQDRESSLDGGKTHDGDARAKNQRVANFRLPAPADSCIIALSTGESKGYRNTRGPLVPHQGPFLFSRSRADELRWQARFA